MLRCRLLQKLHPPFSHPTLLIWHLKQNSCWSVERIGCTWTSWMGKSDNKPESEPRFFGRSIGDRIDPDSLLHVNPVQLLMEDRHFVPNLTIGAPVIQSLRKHTDAFLDCHLMVTNPLDYVEPFSKAGASSFTFHVEAAGDNWQELVRRIRASNMKPGVALRPGTPVEDVFPLIDCSEGVDLVLVMTVEPGFGGQKFMPEMMSKVKTLRSKYPWLHIQVDGGLGPSTINQAAVSGANVIVAGSSIFGSKDPASVIMGMRTKVHEAQGREVEAQ